MALTPPDIAAWLWAEPRLQAAHWLVPPGRIRCSALTMKWLWML
jgi:hypothetical protein